MLDMELHWEYRGEFKDSLLFDQDGNTYCSVYKSRDQWIVYPLNKGAILFGGSRMYPLGNIEMVTLEEALKKAVDMLQKRLTEYVRFYNALERIK